MRVLLFGMFSAGPAVLEAARRAGAEVAGIVLPANPTPNDEGWARASSLPLCAPRDLGAADFVSFLDAHPADLQLVATFDRKIPASVFSRAAAGAFNLHPSLLPKYRGHNPYFWAIHNGETESGVTLHRLTERFDDGPTLLVDRIPITPVDTLGSLWRKLGNLSGVVAERFLRALANGTRLDETPQAEDPSRPRAPRVLDEHLRLTGALSRVEAERLVRAANPFYGARAALWGVDLTVWEIGPAGGAVPPGEVARTDRSLLFGCADGPIEIRVAEFRGERIGTGDLLLAHLAGL